MKLWTFQLIDRWQTLQRDGVLRTHRHDCDPLCDWLAGEMRKRVGPPPEGAAYPICGWHRHGGSCGPPTRYVWECSLWDQPSFVRLEIKVPDEQVLLSDYWRWEDLKFFAGFVPRGNWGQLVALRDDLATAGFLPEILLQGLNLRDLPRLMAAGHKESVELDQIGGVLEHHELGPRIRKSWEVIFDLDFSNKRHPETALPGRWIQGTFWELHLDQVVDARMCSNPKHQPLLDEQKQAQEQYVELQRMTLLKPHVTGIAKAIWITEQLFDESPCIKVSASDPPIPGEWGSISISDHPSAQRGLLKKVGIRDVQAAKMWIRVNKEPLLEHWYYGLDDIDLLHQLKPVDRQHQCPESDQSGN